jgi:hypothetical protein
MTIQHREQMGMVIDGEVKMGVLHIFTPALHFTGGKRERLMYCVVDAFGQDRFLQVFRVHIEINITAFARIDKISLNSLFFLVLLYLLILVFSYFLFSLLLAPLLHSLRNKHYGSTEEPITSPTIEVHEMTALIIVLFEVLGLEAPSRAHTV